LSKSATSEVAAARRSWLDASWRLAGALSAGGLWLLHFLVLPGLLRSGLAPLLVEEAQALLQPLMVCFAAFCAALQLLLLAAVRGSAALADGRGRLLLLALLLGAGYALAPLLGSLGAYARLFAYLAMAFCAALLVIAPAPVGGR